MFTARKDGFTLLELMIVIAIIAIIAAIAIPNLRDARKAANEASAIAMCRAYHSAQNIYREQDIDGNGTLDYAGLGDLLDHNLIDMVDYKWGRSGSSQWTALRHGYLYTAIYGKPSLFKWSIWSIPEEVFGASGNPISSPGTATGDRIFWVDQTGVIRYCIGTDYKGSIWPAIGK